MAEYDTRMSIEETGGICDEVGREYPNLLSILLDKTAEDEVERGVGVIKFEDGRLSVTDIEKGRTGIMSASMTNKNLANMKIGMNEAAEESDSDVLWRAYVHTHPRGDPSLSGADIKWILGRAKRASQSRDWPESGSNTALLAVGRDESGDIIMSGYSISEDLPSFDIIDWYIKQAEGYKNTRAVKTFEKGEGKVTYKGTFDAYEQLLKLVESGYYLKKGALDRCHAIIKGGGEDG